MQPPRSEENTPVNVSSVDVPRNSPSWRPDQSAIHWVGPDTLAAIIDLSDDAVISEDLNGAVRSWNPGAQRLFGYTAEEVIGTSSSILAIPENSEDNSRILSRIHQGEPVVRHETELRTKDGRVLTISFSASPIRDACGKIIGVVRLARDITEQKRTTELQERLAAIVESSDDAILSKDLNGIIRSWNRGAERLFGYTAEEVVGQPISMLAVPERIEEIPDILSRIRQGHRVDHYETKRQTKDGRVLTISLTISPIRDASGTIIGASKVARDITEKKLSEEHREQLLLREKELRETAELLNQIGPTLVSELHFERLAERITHIATRLTGAQFGALFLKEKAADEFTLISSYDNGQQEFPHTEKLSSAPVFGRTFRGKELVRSADIVAEGGLSEGTFPVRSYLSAPVISRSGDVLAGLVFTHVLPDRFTEWHGRIIHGIAAQAAIALDNAALFMEVRSAQEESERSNEDLRRANDDLEQFAFSASHDLKEPLRMVALYSQLLQRRYADQLDTDAQEYFTYVIDGAKRMDKLVGDLLTYTQSAVVMNGSQLEIPVSAAAALQKVKNNLAQAIADNAVTIEHSALPTLSIAEVHLIQLFQNLIENAIKYRGHEPPRIRIGAERDANLWRISIHDNGIGIAPEYTEQVFGIFKRLHTSDKYTGTGIGLAICQRIVTRYGGRIWVESGGEGQGSTFCFTLPGEE